MTAVSEPVLRESAHAPAHGQPRSLVRWLDSLSNRTLVLGVGATLFVLSAWPLLLVAVPPFQDLPNHLASGYVAEHLDAYPDLAFNGLLKSNALLELWLHLWGDGDLLLAGRVFTALVLAVGSFALPVFLLHFVGRRRMVVGALFVWPLVHNFFVSMGMMNFAFGFPLSLVLIVILDRQRRHPTLARGLGIVALSVACWYAHPFPLIVVGVLALVESLRQPTWSRRWRTGVSVLAPLVPVGLLVVATALQHFMKAEGAPVAASKGFEFLTIWELPVHYWLDAQGALTRYGAMTFFPAVALAYVAFRNRRVKRAMFSKGATIALVIAYLGLPLMLSNWWYLNTRLAPFVWVAFAVRVPPRLSRRATVFLLACALSFSAVLGLDYVRLDRDRLELTAGARVIPEHATLLPLLFQHRKTSDFTASLTHAWAFYTLAIHDSHPPLLFAVERSYALTYKTFPPPELIPPALDRFAELHGTPAQVCAADVGGTLGRTPEDCYAAWRTLWASFWIKAAPRFDYVMTWAMPPDTQAMFPPSYRRIFHEGDLDIYQRHDGP
jgi:uncharacterized membrane protein